MRESGGHYLADATIAAAPEQTLVEGHQVADAVEQAIRRALPDSDVVVRVEPRRKGLGLRARTLAIALSEPAVEEAHDVAIYRQGEAASVSLHLKLDAQTPLAEAHRVAERIETTLSEEPGVAEVQTHLEPLEEPVRVATVEDQGMGTAIAALVERRTGTRPRRLRLLRSEVGVVAFVDVLVPGSLNLADAHEVARRLERAIRREHDDAGSPIVDVVVHCEPVAEGR